MTAEAVSGRHVHRRPNSVRRAVSAVSVKIPPLMNTVWDAVENHRRASTVAALTVVATVSVVFNWPIAALLAFGGGVAVLVRAGDLLQITMLRERLAKAERDLDLAKHHAANADADLRQLHAAARMNATSVTVRLPAIEDRREADR